MSEVVSTDGSTLDRTEAAVKDLQNRSEAHSPSRALQQR